MENVSKIVLAEINLTEGNLWLTTHLISSKCALNMIKTWKQLHSKTLNVRMLLYLFLLNCCKKCLLIKPINSYLPYHCYNFRLKKNTKKQIQCSVFPFKKLSSANLLWGQNQISQEKISQHKIWRAILTANDNKRNWFKRLGFSVALPSSIDCSTYNKIIAYSLLHFSEYI